MSSAAAPTRPWRLRWRRAARDLRVRVTATATIAALVLAAIGALVFVVLFTRSMQNSTDAALRTIAGTLVDDLVTSPGPPELPPGSGSARNPVLQLVAPDDTLRQTVATTSEIGPVADDGRTTLATSQQLALARTAPQTYTDRHARVLLTPFTRPDGTWVLVTAADLEQAEDAAHGAKWSFLLVVPLVVVLIGVGAWVLSGAVLRPVERMRSDAAALREGLATGTSAGERTRVREPDSSDRVAALARTLNGLLGDLADASDRERALVADAGHELRTPLAVLRTELELADRPHRDREYLHDAVSHARTEVERLSELAEDLLLLADADRRVARDRRPTSLPDVVDDAVRAHRAVARERGLDLRAEVPAPVPPVVGDAPSLRRVVDNLLGNALAVARHEVVVSVRAVPRDGHAVALEVSDDGPGFAPEFLPHAFERFTRAGDDRRRTGAGGAGLGLAIVAAVATAHGGRATAGNTGHGAQVRVELPVG